MTDAERIAELERQVAALRADLDGVAADAADAATMRMAWEVEEALEARRSARPPRRPAGLSRRPRYLRAVPGGAS